MTSERRQYTAEFKRETVELSETSDRSARQIAEELGIRPKLLYGWRAAQRKHGSEAFPDHGNVSAADRELVELRRELERTCQERDILKKALAIFSRPL
ncbi:MAG: transposase [Anaerolineae bacterium]|nr:transposase [Anaerolineae bacterium]